MGTDIPERLKKYNELVRKAEDAELRAAGAKDVTDRLKWQNLAYVYRAAAEAIAGDLKDAN
jgi:hypothetical protein